MALAVLCNGLNKKFRNSTIKVRAFVVDHAARPGSDMEAIRVARILEKLSTGFISVFGRALSVQMADGHRD